MTLTPLTAISPVDGRYARQTEPLRAIFSEYGLIRRRVVVEIEWLLALADAPDIPEATLPSAAHRQQLRALVTEFDLSAAERVKAIEATTNHDVKAVEYYIKEQLGKEQLGKEQLGSQTPLAPLLEYVHFACTSEDINNLAYALMLRDARADVRLRPVVDAVRETRAPPRQLLLRTHLQVVLGRGALDLPAKPVRRDRPELWLDGDACRVPRGETEVPAGVVAGRSQVALGDLDPGGRA